MAMIIRTSALTTICPDLVLTLINTEMDHSAQLVIGLLFTGLEDSRMEELLLTPNPKVTKDQKPSPSVTIKYSNAGISP